MDLDLKNYFIIQKITITIDLHYFKPIFKNGWSIISIKNIITLELKKSIHFL